MTLSSLTEVCPADHFGGVTVAYSNQTACQWDAERRTESDPRPIRGERRLIERSESSDAKRRRPQEHRCSPPSGGEERSRSDQRPRSTIARRPPPPYERMPDENEERADEIACPFRVISYLQIAAQPTRRIPVSPSSSESFPCSGSVADRGIRRSCTKPRFPSTRKA